MPKRSVLEEKQVKFFLYEGNGVEATVSGAAQYSCELFTRCQLLRWVFI